MKTIEQGDCRGILDWHKSRQTALLGVLAKIRQSLELKEIFQFGAAEVRQLLNADRVVIYRFLPNSNHCLGEIVSEDVLPQYSSALAARVQDPCFGNQEQAQKYRDGYVSRIEDVEALPLNPCYREILQRFQVRANLVVPLLQQHHLWGLLCVHQCGAPRQWQELEIEFASEIGLHLSVAIQQAEFVHQLQSQSELLNQAVQRAVSREKALAQTIDKIRRSLDLSVVFQTTVQEVQDLLSTDRAVIYRFNDDWSGEFVCEAVSPAWLPLLENKDPGITRNVNQCHPQMLSLQFSQDSYLAETGGGAFVRGQLFRRCDDIYSAGFSSCYVKTLESYQARAYIITAIFEGEKLWGLLAVFQNDSPRQWLEDEVKFLVQISGQLGVGIVQANLLEQSNQRSATLQSSLELELRKRAAQLALEANQERSLANLIRQIRQTLKPTAIFPATDGVKDILACDRHSIYRFNSDWTGELVYQSGGDLDWSGIASELHQKQGWIFANQEILVVPNLEKMGFLPAEIKFWRSYGIEAFIHMPIMVGQKLWGILTIYQHQPRLWQEREVRVLSQVASQVGVALQQADLLIQEQKAAAIASAAEQSMSQFLNLMSHELRTPLNSILGFAQLLCLDSSLSETQLENLGIIYRSGTHLLTLINDVLEMSKIEAGQEQLNFEQFEIQGLLTSLKEMLGLKARHKGLELSCSCDLDVPPVIKADQQKLRQVLINLLGNGIKFTDRGRVSLWVSLNPDHRLSFRVEDTGCGIPTNQLESIFEPFIQTEIGKAHEGTGLGLTISKKFVQLMGGELMVTSTLGQGSCFEFTIAVEVAESPTPVSLPIPTKLLLLPHQVVPRILIAEDDPDTRSLMVTMMANLGFVTQTVVDGDQAIAQWQAWQPHLIWLDLSMPGIISGTGVASYIRQQERVQQIPLAQAVKIIGITSSQLASDRDQLLAAGCDQFITKPLDLGLMFAKLAECLNLSYDYDQSMATPLAKEYREIQQQCQQMPSSWHQQLKFAAKAADEEAIATLVEQVPFEFNLLISFLKQSVNDFRLGQIIHLLQ